VSARWNASGAAPDVFEDSTDFGEVPTTYEAEPWPALGGLSDRHLALLRALWHCTEAGGEAVAHARHATLAAMIGLKGEPKPGPNAQGSRQVRRLMNDLYDRGLVVPLDDKHAMVPGRDGGQRLGAKYYALKVPLLALPLVNLQVAPLGHGNSAGRAARTSTPPTRSGKPEEPERETAGRAARTSPAARTWPEADNPQVAPLGHEPPCPSSNVSTTCSPEDSGEGAGVEEIPVVTLTPKSELVEPPPADAPAWLPRVQLRVPERDQLDHDPTANEVRAALSQAFGEVEVLEVRPRPTYRAARHRTLRLDGSLDDFHTALEALERDTCASDADRCIPGRVERCRRHTRRSERRPGAVAA